MINVRPARSAGCSGKVSVFDLRKLLKDSLTLNGQHGVMIGAGDHDDAAVVDISEQDMGVLTVDFMHSPVRSPYYFGRLASAHALNDIYAMGAVPSFGLVILGGPASERGVLLREIMRGVSDIAAEDGMSISGGHTLSTEDPICGLAAFGRPASNIWNNSGCDPGDWIFISKPIGSALLLQEQNALDDDAPPIDVRLFSSCRKEASILRDFQISSATDVSGFGLRYQLGLIATKSLVTVDVDMDMIPIYGESVKAFERGQRVGAVCENGDFFGPITDFPGDTPLMMTYFVDEPQTNGPLLFTMPDEAARSLIELHPDAGFTCIGRIGPPSGCGVVNFGI
ncbi:selenide, water dikinase SelD [Hoeflea sp. AS60]|uniref:selenide, water dikinase SelD n=1 Tax=Hoeflea sp. AS60 TaxID=3135780 RepID=UPI00317434C5